MGDVVIHTTHPADGDELFADLRPSDRRECEAYGLPDIRVGIHASIAGSFQCWTAHGTEGIICIFGVVPISMLDGSGAPWMLGTPLLERHARILMKTCPRYIAAMLRTFPHLMNWVHAENVTSVRWLKRLGFQLDPPAPYGARGAMFHRFEMRA